jgi:hypothetical protein
MNHPSPAPVKTCPDSGAWRVWLDSEDQTPALEGHLADCSGCRRVVAELRADAEIVGDAFALLAPGQSSLPSTTDVAFARERFEAARRRPLAQATPVHSQEPIPMFFTRITTPWRVAASGLAAALVLSLLISITPEGRALAAGFLAQFRSQQVTAVEVTPQSQAEIMKTLNALGNLGTIKTPNGIASRPDAVARGAAEQAKSVTLAEASQAIGFKVETPDPAKLPASVDKTPRVQVMPSSQIRFTFDKAKASSFFKSTGHANVTLPDKFDGATLVVSIPSAAILQYGGQGTKDALIVGQAGELVVDVEGTVSLDEMRDFLLGLPGLPPTVVSQLRQVKKWRETLPIPVPVDQVNWRSTLFHGNQGLLLDDNSGVGSAAIWYESGHMYGVAGSLKAKDLEKIADSLAVR